MDFSQVTEITIPEGSVTKITETETGRVLWEKIGDYPPVITRNRTLTFTVSKNARKSVVGTNVTTNTAKDIRYVTWSASGMPPGLIKNTDDRYVEGTPTEVGTYTPMIYVKTNQGRDNATVTMKVSEATPITYPPYITRSQSISMTVGTSASYNVLGTNTAIDANKGITSVTWRASNLPSGLSINSSTGKISGTPTTAGTYTPKVGVTTNQGSDLNVPITITVSAAVVTQYPPTITRNQSISMTVGTSASYKIQGTNTAINANKGITLVIWRASNLPSGLSINSSTGVISGTPAVAGTYKPTVSVSTTWGSDNNVPITIKVAEAAQVPNPANYKPVIKSNQKVYFQKGWATKYRIDGSNLTVDLSKGITSVQWSIITSAGDTVTDFEISSDGILSWKNPKAMADWEYLWVRVTVTTTGGVATESIFIYTGNWIESDPVMNSDLTRYIYD